MRLSSPALLVLASCSTLASEGHGDSNLASAGVGPFRAIVASEDKSAAPFVLASEAPEPSASSAALYREPSAIAATGDAASMATWLYAVAHDPTSGADVIVRTRADDGRSFYGTLGGQPSIGSTSPAVVLAADRAWEEGKGANLTGPSALRVGGEVWLYYAAAAGIGLAKSSDGLMFTKLNRPVLAYDPKIAWECCDGLHAPSVAAFPDGTFHMLYAAGVSIGEATSADGMTWTRSDDNPVLEPNERTAAPDAKPRFDSGQVGDPHLAPRVEVTGRLLVRVLYSGWDAPPGVGGRNSAIGFAARFGDSGVLVRQEVPVYSARAHEVAPSLFEYVGGSMLYVQQDQLANSLDATSGFPCIAAAVAPASIVLPAPLAFADGP